jgi:hypothetical protein
MQSFWITMRQNILTSFILIFCASSLFAQNKYDFSRFKNETWSFIGQPARWNKSDWLKVGLISAGTWMIMETADQPIREAVLADHQRYTRSAPIESGRMWGELYTPALLFGGFALHSLLSNDTGTRKIAFEIVQGSLYAGVITQLLKMSIGRTRPYVNEGSKSFHSFSSFSFRQEYQSLPSGHNTVAFCLSTVLSRNAGPVWLKGMAYVPALLTWVSRIYQDQHWTSDAFLGAAIGCFVATWVIDRHERMENRIQMSSVYPFGIRIALD